jgi:hypothetical protein
MLLRRGDALNADRSGARAPGRKRASGPTARCARPPGGAAAAGGPAASGLQAAHVAARGRAARHFWPKIASFVCASDDRWSRMRSSSAFLTDCSTSSGLRMICGVMNTSSVDVCCCVVSPLNR